jgi:DNA polymerase elongation subunit (family B)
MQDLENIRQAILEKIPEFAINYNLENLTIELMIERLKSYKITQEAILRVPKPYLENRTALYRFEAVSEILTEVELLNRNLMSSKIGQVFN